MVRPVNEIDSDRLDVTVTYLDMTARPTRPPRPAPILDVPTMILKAEQPTVAFYRHLYAAVGLPWLWFERAEMKDAALQMVLEDENIDIYVLYVGGVPAGFAEFDARRPPNAREGDLHLAYFGLVSEFIGRGLGPFFLDAVVEIAWAREIDRLWLRTCTLDHPSALPVYQKAGFEVFAQEQHLIQDPRERGVIPRVDRPTAP
ncbi:MAG TPA: N-acetyltransferase [Rhodospirillaceae bacterium]|nr:GNAT family N-acetyltransferase [Rhodospirillaceae bacterium]HAA91671.1 N-acetyltransferase [Rhodospirillaceae bacterium]HAT35461.1 N-acetyltransferase [Rhodospirillaceae bacterium]